MSKLFWDHLISLKEVEIIISSFSSSPDEKQDLWNLVDEIIHHRVMGCILDRLPAHHHKGFLEKFHANPHDERILNYLNEKIEEDIEEIIKLESEKVAEELGKELKTKK